MEFVNTNLDGVILVKPRVFADSRGYFFESYNEAVFKAGGINNHFAQDNQSKSSYGVIRGLHCQNGASAQAKLVRVLQGTILDVAVDIREGSPTFGQYVAHELSDENNHQLFIPRGFLHGFSVLSQTAVVAYKCDNLYDKSAEGGVRFDDPAIGIDWKIAPQDAIISEKDAILGTISDVVTYRG